MSGTQAEAAAPAGPAWRPSSSRLVETALAFAALLGLAVGVYLGHTIVGMFGASVIENQVRAEHRQRLWSLQQHAADMTAPGNDIFQSRNVRPETRKFYTSRAVAPAGAHHGTTRDREDDSAHRSSRAPRRPRRDPPGRAPARRRGAPHLPVLRDDDVDRRSAGKRR